MNHSNFCQSGVNLGGWLSQYRQYNHTHFKTFITDSDIRQIADWGMDHIRLPVDYPVLEEENESGIYKESGFDYVESCLQWCQENDLDVILDLHKAPGYDFSETIENHKSMPLFTDPSIAERFYKLWDEIAQRFKGRYPRLHFELLNEVNLPDSTPWNEMYPQAVEHIREIEPDRHVIIGSNKFCAVKTLKEMKLLDDPSIIYTFHFYEPSLFTHQKAHWMSIGREFKQTLVYPGPYTGLEEFLDSTPKYRATYQHLIGIHMNSDNLRQLVTPALEFQQQTGSVLYCGEYGVIDHVDPRSRRAWHRDFLAILREYNIGCAVWSYKCMGFGLVDEHSQVIDPELINIVSIC